MLQWWRGGRCSVRWWASLLLKSIVYSPRRQQQTPILNSAYVYNAEDLRELTKVNLVFYDEAKGIVEKQKAQEMVDKLRYSFKKYENKIVPINSCKRPASTHQSCAQPLVACSCLLAFLSDSISRVPHPSQAGTDDRLGELHHEEVFYEPGEAWSLCEDSQRRKQAGRGADRERRDLTTSRPASRKWGEERERGHAPAPGAATRTDLRPPLKLRRALNFSWNILCFFCLFPFFPPEKKK